MQRFLPGILAAAMVAVLPQWAAAADEKRPERPRPEVKQERPNPEMMFQRLDANHDGVITADELPAGMPDRMKEVLKRAIAAHDGKLTRDQMAEVAKRLHDEGRPTGPRPEAKPEGRAEGQPGRHREGPPKVVAEAGKGRPMPPMAKPKDVKDGQKVFEYRVKGPAGDRDVMFIRKPGQPEGGPKMLAFSFQPPMGGPPMQGQWGQHKGGKGGMPGMPPYIQGWQPRGGMGCACCGHGRPQGGPQQEQWGHHQGGKGGVPGMPPYMHGWQPKGGMGCACCGHGRPQGGPQQGQWGHHQGGMGGMPGMPPYMHGWQPKGHGQCPCQQQGQYGMGQRSMYRPGGPKGMPPMAGRGPQGKPDLKVLFTRMDKDKDGKLSFEEFSAGMKRLHQRMAMQAGPMSGPGMRGAGMPGPHGDRGPMGPMGMKRPDGPKPGTCPMAKLAPAKPNPEAKAHAKSADKPEAKAHDKPVDKAVAAKLASIEKERAATLESLKKAKEAAMAKLELLKKQQAEVIGQKENAKKHPHSEQH